MTALAASQTIRERSTHSQSFEVRNAAVVYAGGEGAISHLTSGTSANRGRLAPFTGAAAEIPVGRVVSPGAQTGDTSATPAPRATIQLKDEIIEAVPVAGASTIAHVGSIVFLNSTDNPKADLTLTRPTRAMPRGIIVAFRSAAEFDVLLFGLPTMLALSGAGRKEIIHLGHFDCDTIADGNLRTAIPMAFRGKILSVHAFVDKAITTTGDSASLNLEIGGTDVTGGVVALTGDGTQAKGVKIDGTAVTAENVFSEGSTIDVEAASTVDMTGGSIDLYMVVERLPGV